MSSKMKISALTAVEELCAERTGWAVSAYLRELLSLPEDAAEAVGQNAALIAWASELSGRWCRERCPFQVLREHSLLEMAELTEEYHRMTEEGGGNLGEH